MDTWINWLQSNEGIGLCVALGIFFVTLFMAAKRWIGLTSTIVLMFLSIAIGYAIAHPESVQDLLRSFTS